MMDLGLPKASQRIPKAFREPAIAAEVSQGDPEDVYTCDGSQQPCTLKEGQQLATFCGAGSSSRFRSIKMFPIDASFSSLCHEVSFETICSNVPRRCFLLVVLS